VEGVTDAFLTAEWSVKCEGEGKTEMADGEEVRLEGVCIANGRCSRRCGGRYG
jgi:hypothetical protein